jgi:hypothetical protein
VDDLIMAVLERGWYALLPPILAAGFLIQRWQFRELYGVSGAVFVSWYVLALVAQMSAYGPPVWAIGPAIPRIGLGAQVLLLILLLVKLPTTPNLDR